MRQFVFLYPSEQNFVEQLQAEAMRSEVVPPQHVLDRLESAKGQRELWAAQDEAMAEMVRIVRPMYSAKINRVLDERYRKKGFIMNFATLSDQAVSGLIDVRPEDQVINVGLSWTDHSTEQADGSYIYPDEAGIINQLGPLSYLVVTGFHMFDCVDRVAMVAHQSGIETLVDEDLGQWFSLASSDPGFRADHFPSVLPDKETWSYLSFISARRVRPWMWQKY